jgi:hypothetical protein
MAFCGHWASQVWERALISRATGFNSRLVQSFYTPPCGANQDIANPSHGPRAVSVCGLFDQFLFGRGERDLHRIRATIFGGFWWASSHAVKYTDKKSACKADLMLAFSI